MKHGKCTNLPTECTLAADGELQVMPSDSARCAECNSLLTPVFEKQKQTNKLPLIVLGVAILLLLALLAFAYYYFTTNNDDNSVSPVTTTTLSDADIQANDVQSIAENEELVGSVNSTVLDVQGSNTIGSELMPKLVEAYYASVGTQKIAEKETGFDEMRVVFSDKRQQRFGVHLASHGSSTGFKALAAGEANAAMSSRKIKQEESELLDAKGLGDMQSSAQEFVIGIDGIAVIVHPSNTIDAISVSDLRRIFSGEITNWSELGGDNQPINLYVRDENSGTKDTFESLVMNKVEVAQAKEFEDSNQLSQNVSDDVGAIGYIGLPYINMAKPLAISDGTASALKPTSFTLSTEDYPLTRRLYLYIPLDASSDARALANFAVSAQGQQIVEQSGFIGQKASSEKITNVDMQAIGSNEGYKALIDHAERVNMNFRFATSSSQLDNKAKQDLGRVTQLLQSKTQQGEDYRLVLVGFTDNTGAECINNSISLQRARQVADELATYGIKADVVEGMGADAPVANNNTASGRERNRRVEMWLAPLQQLPKFPIKPTCSG